MFFWRHLCKWKETLSKPCFLRLLQKWKLWESEILNKWRFLLARQLMISITSPGVDWRGRQSGDVWRAAKRGRINWLITAHDWLLPPPPLPPSHPTSTHTHVKVICSNDFLPLSSLWPSSITLCHYHNSCHHHHHWHRHAEAAPLEFTLRFHPGRSSCLGDFNYLHFPKNVITGAIIVISCHKYQLPSPEIKLWYKGMASQHHLFKYCQCPMAFAKAHSKLSKL